MEVESLLRQLQQFRRSFSDLLAENSIPLDVSLISDDWIGPIDVHGVVLRRESEYFQRIYNKLGSHARKTPLVIVIKGYDLDTVKNAVYFMYEGRIRDKNSQLLEFASEFEIQGLIDAWEKDSGAPEKASNIPFTPQMPLKAEKPSKTPQTQKPTKSFQTSQMTENLPKTSQGLQKTENVPGDPEMPQLLSTKEFLDFFEMRQQEIKEKNKEIHVQQQEMKQKIGAPKTSQEPTSAPKPKISRDDYLMEKWMDRRNFFLNNLTKNRQILQMNATQFLNNIIQNDVRYKTGPKFASMDIGGKHFRSTNPGGKHEVAAKVLKEVFDVDLKEKCDAIRANDDELEKAAKQENLATDEVEKAKEPEVVAKDGLEKAETQEKADK